MPPSLPESEYPTITSSRRARLGRELGGEGRGAAEVVDRLEQRHDRDVEAGLARRATPPRGRRPPSASSTRSACRSPRARAAAGAPRPPRGRRSDLVRLVAQRARVEPEVERRPGEAEDVEAPPQRGEAAVGDPRAAVVAEARLDEVELGTQRPRPTGRRRRRAAPRSTSAAAGTAPSGCAPPAGRRRRRRRRRRRACSTCPRRRRARGRRGGEARGRAPTPRSTASRTVSAPAFGFPSRSPPIHVPNRSGVPGRRSRQAASRSAAASQRLSSRNQSACRISSTTRGRSERTSSVCHRIVISSASATSPVEPLGRA